MRLRSEWNDELENLKARFDWEIMGTLNFDAFWRFFGLNYKDFWEIWEIVILGENGWNGLKSWNEAQTAETAENRQKGSMVRWCEMIKIREK